MKKYILLLFILPVLASCKKFLEEKPYSFLSTNNFYKNESDAIAALNGVFSSLQPQTYYQRTVWLVGELPGDLLRNNGGPAARTELDRFTYGPTNDEITNWWVSNYTMINRANDVIANVPNISMDVTRRNNIVGNARFLRALGYFELVRSFGDVPLLLQPTTSIDNIKPSRKPIAEVYKQIIEDLKYAEANCFTETQIKNEKGRVSTTAASSLLGKVYLTRATTSAADPTDNATALTYLNKVINSGVYSLMPKYADVFDVEKENGPEQIFSVQFDLAPNTGNITPRMHLPNAGGLGGFGSFFVETGFMNSFDAADTIRKNFTISNKAGSVTVTPYFNKFRDPKRSGNSSRVNWVIIRYADVLLMQSEAMNQINPLDPAKFNGINAVRARAGLTGTKQLDFVSTPTKDDFVTALINERAWELAAEGYRRWDLLRLGRLKQVMAATGITVDDKLLLFPIPQSEIALNANLTQNPGY